MKDVELGAIEARAKALIEGPWAHDDGIEETRASAADVLVLVAELRRVRKLARDLMAVLAGEKS